MQITQRQIRRLINEALLTELFNSPPYTYRVKELNIVSSAHAEEVIASGGGKVTQQDVLYQFTTDPTTSAGNGFEYVVSFTLDMLSDPALMPWESALDPENPDNYFWTIIFEAKELGNPDSDYDITQTHQGDMRVFSTISSIVKHFVTEVLQETPDHDVKTFSFAGSVTNIFDDQKGHVTTVPADEGLSRRTKIYLAMLKKNLPKGAKIIPVPRGGYHSAGSDENIIFFKVP